MCYTHTSHDLTSLYLSCTSLGSHINIAFSFPKFLVDITRLVFPEWSFPSKSVKMVPPSTKKNQNLFGNNGLFMGSRIAHEIICWLFPFSRHMILKWGGGGGGGVLASPEDSATFFPRLLNQIWLVPDLWDLYGLFRYATNNHPQTTPEKLSTL